MSVGVGFYLMLAAGGLCIAAGIFNWTMFFSQRRTALIQSLFGETGVRVAYVISGILLIALAIYASRI